MCGRSFLVGLGQTLTLVLLGSCAQLAGIDETSAGDGAQPGTVSLTFERVSIGATIVKGPLDLSANQASYLVPDAALGFVRVPTTLQSPGTWTAPIVDGTPAVVFDVPEDPVPQQRMFALPNRELRASFVTLEHPDRTPAPAGATLAVTVTLDAPYAGNETLQLFTMGSWNTRTLEAPLLGTTTVATPPFAFTSMTSTTGRPHEKLTTADAVLVLKLIGNQLVGALEVPPFEQTGMDTIMGTITAVPRTETLDVTVDQAAAATRFSAVRPAVAATPAMSWALRAAPGAGYAVDNGPLLHAAAVTPLDPEKITVAYGNPFTARGWPTLLTWSTTAARTYTPPALALPVTLRAQMFQRALPTAGMVLDLPAGLPELITMNGMSLSTDGLTISTQGRPVEISFLPDRTANTMYVVEIFELVPNAAATALVLTRVMTAAGVAPQFTLPAEVFVTGKHYTVRAMTVKGGFPNIATGDMQTRSLPIAQALLDSGVFQVGP
ncbi:MAG: hypothetical protein M3680_10745 [Myxococcota bacterium]|nr:hypothetical protein [Myxococcota bacterium]